MTASSEYFRTLNLSESASDEEIKQAYRKLAREHHPDKGGDKDKFQKIQEAYEILSNPDKRNNLDSNIQSDNMHFSFSHSFFNFSQQQQTIQKQNYFYNLSITLEDVYNGTCKKLRLSRKLKCNSCSKKCNVCNGSGSVTKSLNMGIFQQTITQTCTNCSGNGSIKHGNECSLCNSTGEINDSQIMEIQISKGVEDKKEIVFEGWGEQAKKDNEISGNFIVVINIEKHAIFERKNSDLIYTHELSLKESLIGKYITIPHFSGDIKINTSGFGIINPNVQYTIFNKGMKDTEDKPGNLHIRFKIQYPTKTLDNNQIQTLQKVLDEIDL